MNAYNSHEDVPAAVATVLAAALDGHDPNRETLPDGSIRMHTGRGKSDLDITIEELRNIPVYPQVIYREFAQQSLVILHWIAWRHDIDRDELVATFRKNAQSLQALRHMDVDRDGNLIPKSGDHA